jgi:hypothetical protein
LGDKCEQREANSANSLKSTGPRSELGKFCAKLNATKHGLSLPVDERAFADQIKTIAQLIKDDCETDLQAVELAKRINDFERNEAFLQEFNEKAIHDEMTGWGIDPLSHRDGPVSASQAQWAGGNDDLYAPAKGSPGQAQRQRQG